MLDCQIFGLHAGGHHLVNVLWHAANAVLLFLVLRQMTGSLWRSAFVAAVFAVHPLRAESVAWVSERKDVLSGFFFMLTIGAYVRYAEKCAIRHSLIHYALFTVPCFSSPWACWPRAWWRRCRLCCCCWIIGRWDDECRRTSARQGFRLLLVGGEDSAVCSCGRIVRGDGAGARPVRDGCPPTPFPGTLRQRPGFLCGLYGANGIPGGIGQPLSLPPKRLPDMAGLPGVCAVGRDLCRGDCCAGKSAPACWRAGSGIWGCWFR